MKKSSFLLVTVLSVFILATGIDLAQAEQFVLSSDIYMDASIDKQDDDRNVATQQGDMKSKRGTFKLKSGDAIQGKVRVKLTEGAAHTLAKKMGKSAVLQTRSSSAKLKTGITTMDVKFQALKATSIKRVFPYHPRYEERQKKMGLHLWYEVDIDTTAVLNTVCDELTKDENVLFVEPILKKEILDIGGKKVKGTVSDESGIAQSKVFLSPISSDVSNKITTKASRKPLPASTRDYEDDPPTNDPLLLKQWHYYNYGQVSSNETGPSVIGADIKLFDAWKVNMGDSRVIVSVHDQGIESGHM